MKNKDAKVLNPRVQEIIFSIPEAYREAEFNGEPVFKIVSIDWILEHCQPDVATRMFLEGISTAFDHDNFKGRMNGQLIYRNP